MTDQIFYYTNTGKQALLLIVCILGLGAALIMNDTIAIIGTPIILQLCKSHKNLIKPLLFALAFSITIGSAMSPIGNPQNLLIAIKGEIISPFIVFIKYLTIPTLLNLAVTYLFICLIYRDSLNTTIEKPIPTPIGDSHTVRLVKISLTMMVILVGIKIVMDFLHTKIQINFSYIALLSAIPILLSNQRWVFIKKLDWGTLVFFASTFILMQSVWDSGFFQANMNHFHISVNHIAVILLISVILSQFISNVPWVALYLPLLMHHSHSNLSLLSLAVGSTIAGNLSILGAASNIIIIQNSEKRGVKGVGFFEFIKIGAPLTLINLLIYAYFLQGD
ncbi:SLC13 family permease [uncultured Legionella sp.]|uniref:SLC13 family permease n=1 Tax=uncultured Legionella sp. TaxID=210934 RepID=UPI002630CE1B|nr:SLC13 family permease [uncultured Legionella sp.]